MSISPADGARLSRAAEDMYAPGVLTPYLPESIAANWILLAHITAANALFGAQAIGIGERCYYGFIAQSKTDERNLIAVFRGTESILEWLEDAHCLLVPSQYGLVEHGFWSIYGSAKLLGLSETLAPALAKMLLPKSTITVIGHSLGGALATYLTLDLAAIADREFDVHGMFYASPKPGDARYARSFQLYVGDTNYTAYSYLRDLVPHLPISLPLGLGFQRLAKTFWIRPGDSTVKIPQDLGASHNALNYADLLDHLITTGEHA